jgi:hypothetical protein
MKNKSRWEQYKEKNGVTLLDALNPQTKKAEENKSEERYKICLSCPELVQLTKQCKKCGCFMPSKTKLESAKCPLQKW